MARWAVLGCGYTGGALAARLAAEGHELVVTRRDPAAAAAAVRPYGASSLSVELARPETLDSLADDAIVVCAAPPGPDPGRELAALARFRRVVYLSSTGVYPAAAGAWVDESWPVAPITASGRARAKAEAALADNAVALRVAGIHGPGRGLVDRIRAGTYRVIGDGTCHVSRIHVADLVEAIVRAGASDIRGPINVADDDPAPIGEVADAIAAQLGLSAPPRVAASAVDPEIAGMLTADRRIANARMKRELGVVLRYPSWRDA